MTFLSSGSFLVNSVIYQSDTSVWQWVSSLIPLTVGRLQDARQRFFHVFELRNNSISWHDRFTPIYNYGCD